MTMFEQRVSDILTTLTRLVAFRPVSSASNLGLIHFCREQLAACGVESVVLPSPDGSKGSLYATIGPMVRGGILFSGHTDVVPVEGQLWTSDPWTLAQRNRQVFGRGTSDMLGFVALVIASAPMFKLRALKRPIHIGLSYNEETDCSGGKLLAATLGRVLPAPAAVIVGEPTQEKVVTGHKAYTELITNVTGTPVHSSRTDLGASALAIAARLVAYIDQLQAANSESAAHHDKRFLPPFSTLHCGTFEGGTAPTTVASHATFSTDIRTIPGDQPNQYLRQILEYARTLEQYSVVPGGPVCSIQIDVTTDIPGLSPEPGSSAEMFMGSIGLEMSEHTMAGGTEAGLFQREGWPTLVCGPGDLRRAHLADEFISVDEIGAFCTILDKIADRLCDVQ